MLKAQDGVVPSPQQHENIGHACPQLGSVGPDLHRFIERLQGLFVKPLLLQRGAEARKIIRRGSCPIGAIDPLDGGCVLSGMEGKQAHEMERIRMPGIKRQRSLATKLSVKMPSCSQMAEAGFIELGRGVPAGTVRNGLGFAAGRSALMAIHRRLHMGITAPVRRFSASQTGVVPQCCIKPTPFLPEGATDVVRRWVPV